MNLLVAPKPLFNSEMAVEGYYFSYSFGNAILESTKSNPLDGAMLSPFIPFMNDVGLEALTQGHILFIPVTQILMMTELNRECRVEPGKVAFLAGRDIELNDMLLQRVQFFSGLGYKIAFRDIEDLTALRSFLPFTDYVFYNLPQDQLLNRLAWVRTQNKHVKMVATDVANQPVFDRIKRSGIHLFDGPFYKVHIPTSAKQNALSPLKVNYIQLLNIVNQNDFDFQAFTRIVRQDTALAIRFMQLVNSSSRFNGEIKDINQAAAMLGQREIKKWVATAVSTALCADRPSEITRLSLLRAKFCENMAKHFEMGILQDNLFLMGLMSVLDVILEVPMEDALKMVFVPEPIRRALAQGRGDYYRVLHFVLDYEQGDWREISRLAMLTNIAISDIHDAYVNAMLWYSQLINTPAQTNVI